MSPQELDDFEQELVDQFALAAAAAGCGPPSPKTLTGS
jgi:hypothetical protein